MHYLTLNEALANLRDLPDPDPVPLPLLAQMETRTRTVEDRAALYAARKGREAWETTCAAARHTGFLVSKRPGRCVVTGAFHAAGTAFVRRTPGGWRTYGACVVRDAVLRGLVGYLPVEPKDVPGWLARLGARGHPEGTP